MTASTDTVTLVKRSVLNSSVQKLFGWILAGAVGVGVWATKIGAIEEQLKTQQNKLDALTARHSTNEKQVGIKLAAIETKVLIIENTTQRILDKMP